MSGRITVPQRTAAAQASDPAFTAAFAAKRVVIPADKTDNYTTTAADAGASTGIDKATSVTVTIAPGVHATGDLMEYRQVGVGQVTLAPGAGVTLRSSGGLKLRTQYSAGSVLCLDGAANLFSVSGDVRP